MTALLFYSFVFLNGSERFLSGGLFVLYGFVASTVRLFFFHVFTTGLWRGLSIGLLF